MAWKPIKRINGSDFDVREHPRDASLLVVAAGLSAEPPKEWWGIFDYLPGYVGPTERVKRLSEVTVAVVVESEAQAPAGVAEIDERIEIANRTYERYVLPALRAQEEQRKREENSTAERLAAVRAILKEL